MRPTTFFSILLIGAYFIVVGFNYIPPDYIFPLFLIIMGIAGMVYSLGKVEDFKGFHVSYKAASLFWSTVIVETGCSFILLNMRVPPLSVLGLYIVLVATTYYIIKKFF